MNATNSTTNAPPQPAAAGAGKLDWKCLDFRRHEKKTLQGFAKFQHLPTGVTINDCPVHEKESKRWISFPARSYQKNLPGHDAPETQWIPIVEIPDRDQYHDFQDAALAALNAYLRSPEYGRKRQESTR